MFLGSERKEVKHFNVSFYEYLSLGMLALLCVVIGLYPQPFIGIVTKVLNNGFVPINSSAELLNINWSYISLIFGVILFGIVLVYLWKRVIQKKYGRRTADAWGCGYENINPRMQYTASSFADEFADELSKRLATNKTINITAPNGILVFYQDGNVEILRDDKPLERDEIYMAKIANIDISKADAKEQAQEFVEEKPFTSCSSVNIMRVFKSTQPIVTNIPDEYKYEEDEKEHGVTPEFKPKIIFDNYDDEGKPCISVTPRTYQWLTKLYAMDEAADEVVIDHEDEKEYPVSKNIKLYS